MERRREEETLIQVDYQIVFFFFRQTRSLQFFFYYSVSFFPSLRYTGNEENQKAMTRAMAHRKPCSAAEWRFCYFSSLHIMKSTINYNITNHCRKYGKPT